MNEISILKRLERFLKDKSAFPEDKNFPIYDIEDFYANNIGCSIENDAVLALSLRYCALDSLPEAIEQLTEL